MGAHMERIINRTLKIINIVRPVKPATSAIASPTNKIHTNTESELHQTNSSSASLFLRNLTVEAKQDRNVERTSDTREPEM